MIHVNLSNTYRSQRDNRIVPLSSCGATSAVMALHASGWELPESEWDQPEDALTEILLSDEAHEYRDTLGAWARAYPPNQIHAVMEWAINKWLGERVDTFTERGSVRDIVWRLFNGSASVVNGMFHGLDHQVAVVGFFSVAHRCDWKKSEDVDLETVINIIVDDPYGNHWTGYEKADGDNVAIGAEDFMAITHIAGQENQKWIHRIKGAG